MSAVQTVTVMFYCVKSVVSKLWAVDLRELEFSKWSTKLFEGPRELRKFAAYLALAGSASLFRYFVLLLQ
jgi:hypothetical protein